MNAVRSNNVSLKYQRFTSSACKDIGFTKTEFVAKTQFLWFNYKDLSLICWSKSTEDHMLVHNAIAQIIIFHMPFIEFAMQDKFIP